MNIFLFYSLSILNYIKYERNAILILTKRLTEKQKEEIVRSFQSGIAIDVLSKNYSCTAFTIIRNLKKNLGEIKYKELTKKNKSLKVILNSDDEITSVSNTKHDDEVINKDLENSNQFANISNSDFTPVDSFFEIAPIDYAIDNSSRKELSSVPISGVDFPKIVYMIVDKKIELEIKLLKDFPEWDFLPDDDLNRKTIEIFFDLNLAKKTCNKDQKVLKVPNTEVFRIAAPLLIKKGISRIVCAENLIAL